MIFARKSSIKWNQLFVFLAASILAFVFGLIAVTNNLVLIGLAIGLVLGVFLLSSPKKTIWLVIGLGLISPALLDMAGPGYSKILWAISTMALLLWVPGILNLFDINAKEKKSIPLFVWAAILFTCVALISTLFKLHTSGEMLGGFKRYFQAFGLMLALATLALTRKDFNQWLKFLLVIALIQLPFSLFERLVLVKERGGFADWGAAATDVVAGTFGANLFTGSPNSIMVIYILMASAFVVSRWKVGVIHLSRMLILVSIILMPIFLGETKIVIVMLPLMAFVLLRKEIWQNPAKYLPVIFAMLIFTALLAFFYVYVLLASNFSDAYVGSMSYNIGNVGYGEYLLNRTTVMTFWWDLHGSHEPLTFLFGHGLGSSYDSNMNAGHVAQLYVKHGINLTTISTILWDLGLIGLLLYVSIFIIMWVQVGKVWQRTNNIVMKADCLAIQVGIAFTLLFLFYSDSQVNLMAHEIIVAVLIGYAAFLYQEQRRELVVSSFRSV